MHWILSRLLNLFLLAPRAIAEYNNDEEEGDPGIQLEDEDEDEYEMDTNVPGEENGEYEEYPEVVGMILKLFMFVLYLFSLL